jgi:hypothetical protein
MDHNLENNHSDSDLKPEAGDRRSEDPRSLKDSLDRELDAALAKYALAEPRAGLEERVLASLRARRKHAAPGWLRWTAAAAFAATMILVVASLTGKMGQRVLGIAEHPAPVMAQKIVPSGVEVADLHPTGVRKPTVRVAHRPPTMVVSVPRLEQFPSPQPLSEQEAILARYVSRYPEHAALIAQARTEELRRDTAEEMDSAVTGGNQNSQQ